MITISEHEGMVRVELHDGSIPRLLLPSSVRQWSAYLTMLADSATERGGVVKPFQAGLPGCDMPPVLAYRYASALFQCACRISEQWLSWAVLADAGEAVAPSGADYLVIEETEMDVRPDLIAFTE